MVAFLTWVLIFVGMMFLVLFHACVSEWFSRRGGRGAMLDRGRRRISKIDLEKLPCYDYVVDITSTIDCAICLENFTIGDKCRLLPICKHSFHAHCVDQWLLKHAICPICRSMVGSHSANKVVIGNNGREIIESGLEILNS